MQANAFPKTHEVLAQGIAEGVAPGFVAGVWRASVPDRFEIAAIGRRRVVPSPQPMLQETVFDVASLTKVMATAALAGVLVDRGWLHWDTPLRSILSDYPKDEVQLRHLLSHTAGLPAWSPLWEELRDQYRGEALFRVPVSERQRAMRKLVMEVPAEAPVGKRVVYSDISFLLLGFALEEITQQPLDRAVNDLVWKAMGLAETFFVRVERDVEEGRLESTAATEESEWRGGVLQGQVHDDNCWAMGGYGGHAGVFSTASDVLRFSAKLMGGFLSGKTLETMWTRVNAPVGCERTLGWDTPSGPESSAGRYFSEKTVGHLGFTGTSLWIDLEARIAVTLLSNRVHPSRENIKIRAFRPRFHDALREDLGLRR